MVILINKGMALIQVHFIRCMPITLWSVRDLFFCPRTPDVRGNLDFFWTARLAQRDWSFDFGQNSFSDPRDRISFKSHQSSGTCSELPSRNH